ncbi:transcriptional adapter 3-B [Diachasma alloeum]|uniref:transcriptional adapter 3-B n=1 Tax=Diachasma alloeum TaxID=454923 RepID=UPI0007381966|nr:transcriptional adapter 3-B [Diachasma alloeum]
MSGKGKLNTKKTPIKVRDSVNKVQTPVQSSDTSADSPEMASALPVIKVCDNSKLLPRYTSILQRPVDEGVGMEDLDILQLELETLLSSVVVRNRMLQEEISCLSSAEERRDKRSKSGKGLSPFDKKIRDEKSRTKDLNVKTQSPLPAKLFKAKSTGSSSNQIVPNPHEIVRIEGSKTDIPKLLLPKNDTTNKFWASVDPYCSDIMPDDIKLLEELIASHSDTGDFKKIPPLGRHYSYLWAHNDLLQEEDAANPNRDKKKGRSDVSGLLAKADKKVNGMAGPLTQRLVSALLEENVYVANNNSDNKLFRDGDPPVLRDLSIQNSMNLELRMHKELVEQGILEPDVNRKNQEDDEILAEIKRCQQDLMALSSHNVAQLKRLLNLAQEESKRQALKRKISAADNEVVEHYKKLIVSKQRKTPLTRKEQEKAWTCLREREGLLQQLNGLPSNSIGEPVNHAVNLTS